MSTMIGVLALFKNSKLNKTKTKQNVKDFFANDFNHYLNLANKHLSDISAPKLDPNAVAVHDGRNHADEKILVNMDARCCVQAVDDTISSCSYPSGLIIYLYFIKRMTDDKIAERLTYSPARYYQLKNDALIEFAERLDYWRQIDHASLNDLRAFEKTDVI